MAAAAALVLLTAMPPASLAHHSVAGFFDPNDKIEIEGVVTSVSWRNPHVEFGIEESTDSADTVTWRVESGALGVLRARGVDREFLQVGDHVRVLGDASLRNRPETFARNILLVDGREVLLTSRSVPYFSLQSDSELLPAAFDREFEQAARLAADGLFRVWSTNLDEIPHSGARMFHGDYPMTPEAEAASAAWDPGSEALLGCTEWTMPYLMSNPLPMEFTRDGGDLLLRFEEDDNRRRIHMDPVASDRPASHSRLGYSTGRWEGDTLIVETTQIVASTLDRGIPHSDDTWVVERFTASPDGTRLDYEIRISDPLSFARPLELERYWIWRPEIAVETYACDQEQGLR